MCKLELVKHIVFVFYSPFHTLFWFVLCVLCALGLEPVDWDWRDGSKCADCSRRVLEFGSQHPHRSTHNHL